MSADAFRFEPYAWSGGREWMLARGRSDGNHILVIPPLFEEMNFTRAVLAQIGRALAGRGVATWLPDLPGTGESVRALASVGWRDWRDAARAAGEAVAERTGAMPLTVALRGGALLDDAVAARGRWRYAPVAGETLLQQLRRAQRIADVEAGVGPAADGTLVELAGYPLAAALREGLASAQPAAVADREVAALPEGTPWRRAEPSGDHILSEILTNDICDWAAACASR